jgi:hypothetical protein
MVDRKEKKGMLLFRLNCTLLCRCDSVIFEVGSKSQAGRWSLRDTVGGTRTVAPTPPERGSAHPELGNNHVFNEICSSNQ